jgi:site-specific DNA-methyltransferase (adenine-specific)
MNLILGDCLEVMKGISSDSVSSIVTDPPAGISFMGKDWDKDKGGRDNWIAWMREVMEECLRVLKPGAHGFVWALPRTSHWTATALENAGFEVRDVVTHIFGSGFPKNHNVSKAIDKMHGAEREIVGKAVNSYPDTGRKDMHRSGGGKIFDAKEGLKENLITKPSTKDAKQWEGWGSALKPSNEHWILVRKPLEKKLTVAKNVLKHGTGAINIDASRIETSDKLSFGSREIGDGIKYGKCKPTTEGVQNPQGRFPANTIVDESAQAELDEQSGDSKSVGGQSGVKKSGTTYSKNWGEKQNKKGCGFGDSGGASRFFYCPKAPKKDKGPDNKHPTVKNTKLMSYLINMITPPNGVVLDPFMGSGSTGVASQREGFGFIGIEMEEEYFNIAKERIK